MLDDDLSNLIPMGALVKLVQKGIQLMEIEHTIRKDSRNDDSDNQFTLLSALSNDDDELKDETSTQQIIPQNNKKENSKEEEAEGEINTNGKPLTKDNNISVVESTSKEPEVQIDALEKPNSFKILTTVYETAPAQCSSWNPNNGNMLAIGDLESAVSIITFTGEDVDPTIVKISHPILVPMVEKDVTVVSWNRLGTLLATATYDGQIRLWEDSGKLRHILTYHRLPVLALYWNKSCSLFLSLDCSNSVAIWDAVSGELRQSFQHLSHDLLTYDESSALLETPSMGSDADWIDGVTYATTGDNASIIVYKVGERTPMIRFQGHSQGINSLKFDPDSQLLSSGSDDHTIRIWHGKSPVAVSTLTGHTGPVLVTRWLAQPETITEALDPQAFKPSILISSSVDGNIRIWEPVKGQCLEVLAAHTAPVFCCEISPDGKRLASGGGDGVLIIWDISNINRSQPNTDKTSNRIFARHQLSSPEAMTDEDSTIGTVSWNNSSNRVYVSYGTKSMVLAVP